MIRIIKAKMTQVSRYPISKDVYDRCWEIFTKTLIGIKNSQDVDEIVSDLLTPTERIMLTKRLAIAFLLTQGYEYREVEKILHVSFQTIAMVNNALRYGNNGYKKAVNRILKDEKLKDILNKTAQILITPATYGGQGSGAWRYLKRELQKKSKNRKAF